MVKGIFNSVSFLFIIILISIFTLPNIVIGNVFSNLIRNAVKTTSELIGKITIEADVDEAVKLVVIKARDNGYGIREDNLPLYLNASSKVRLNRLMVIKTVLA